MKKLVHGLLFTCFAISMAAMPASKANAALIETDIVIFMDESASMDADGSGLLTTNIFSNLSLFDSSLLKRNIKANYAVVAFGGSSNNWGYILQNFTNSLSELFDTVSDENTGLEYSGAEEYPFLAIRQALDIFGSGNALNYTASAIKNFIVFTDEDPDDSSDAEITQNELIDNDVRLNAVLSGGSTTGSLGSVAMNTGGNVFDLDTLIEGNESQVNDFMSNLGDVKATEIIDQYCGTNPDEDVCTDDNNPVNAPATLGLMFAGLVALGMRQRRRRI